MFCFVFCGHFIVQSHEVTLCIWWGYKPRNEQTNVIVLVLCSCLLFMGLFCLYQWSRLLLAHLCCVWDCVVKGMYSPLLASNKFISTVCFSVMFVHELTSTIFMHASVMFTFHLKSIPRGILLCAIFYRVPFFCFLFYSSSSSSSVVRPHKK